MSLQEVVLLVSVHACTVSHDPLTFFCSLDVINVLLSTPIFANEYETNLEIQNEARYTHIDKASSNLSISGGVATLTASMTANPGVSKTLITSRLQKKEIYR